MKENATIGVTQPDGTILALYSIEDGIGKYPNPEYADDEMFPVIYQDLEEWLIAYPKCAVAFLTDEDGMRAYFRVVTGFLMILDEHYAVLPCKDGSTAINMCHWVDEDDKVVTGELPCKL